MSLLMGFFPPVGEHRVEKGPFDLLPQNNTKTEPKYTTAINVILRQLEKTW